MLRRLLPGCLLIVSLLPFTGCMDVHTVVKVSRDGSGTVVQRIQMQRQAFEQMKAMAAGMGGQQGQGSMEMPSLDGLFEEENFRKQADMMGSGVRFVRMEPIEDANTVGAIAHYRFADISELHLGTDPGQQSGLKQSLPGGMPSPDSPQDPITFSFQHKTDSSILKINMP